MSSLQRMPFVERITAGYRSPMRRLVVWGLLSGLLLGSVGCASSGPIPPSRPSHEAATERGEPGPRERARLDALRGVLDARSADESSGGLTVRLAFEGDADLDLFVTDPAQESVYFANSPTRSGGILVADRRCEDPAPRVETIRFSDPPAGRYRVGVDFPRRCPADSSVDGVEPEAEALYVVRVEQGTRVLQHEGWLAPFLFEVIVLEFDVPAPPPASVD